MKNIFKKRAEKTLYVPVKGTVIKREEIPDETFAAGMLGDGVGIEPAANEVLSPADGEISFVAKTRHALGLTRPDGMEILIHVGVDTVKMAGEGFEVFAAVGDRVKKGQRLMRFDPEKIQKAGFHTTTAVIVTNSDAYKEIHVIKYGEANAMEKLIEVR